MSSLETSINTTIAILEDIARERNNQRLKWGIQHRPEFPTPFSQETWEVLRDSRRKSCDLAESRGPAEGMTGGASWFDVLEEETAEAYAETTDKAKRRKELIQSAAVLVAWIEDLDNH